MANKSVILQKKLHELESELANITHHPAGPTSSGPHMQMAFDDIKQRFTFLNNLLVREIASQPQNSDQLHQIGHRLVKLEAIFRRWNEWKLSVCSDCTQALLQANVSESGSSISETGIFPGEKSPEKLLCNFTTEESLGLKKEDCNQVVPYDDVSESISDLEDLSSGEKTPDKFYDSREKDENVIMKKEEAAAEEKKVWSKMGKYSGVFGCGMIFGAICMVKLPFISPSHIDFIEFGALLLPPT